MSQKYRRTFLALHGKNERLFAREIQKAIRKDINDVNGNMSLFEPIELEKAIINGIIKYGTQIGSIEYNRLTKTQKRNNPFFSQFWQNYVLSNVRGLVGVKIVTITNTLKEDVQKLVEQLMQNNTGIFDISREITKFVNKSDFYKWQSLRIARTETTVAMNTAVNVAGVQTGLKIQKKWLSAGDGNERESHKLMNGTTAENNGTFGNGLLYPGDPNGQASEIINCRCTFLQIPIRT